MDEAERIRTVQEAKILESLNQPNIIKFKEVYKTKKGKLCIVMEYADGGDLDKKILEYKKKKKFIPEKIIID
jgi:NIMA (never in mitosis gene a)-related kinase